MMSVKLVRNLFILIVIFNFIYFLYSDTTYPVLAVYRRISASCFTGVFFKLQPFIALCVHRLWYHSTERVVCGLASAE